MQTLLSGQQMQAADRYTQETIGLSSIVLMERAALATAERICALVQAPETGRPRIAAVLAGRGNNGADALAVGRLLIDRGWRVQFYLAEPDPEEGSNLYTQVHILRQYGCKESLLPLAISVEILEHSFCDAYVDGLFGIGLARDMEGIYADAVMALNRGAAAHGAAVVAVDIPSGVDATDGHICGTAVQATETVTYGYAKRGQYLYPGCTYCGHLTVADIGIPAWSHKGPAWFTYDTETAEELMPARRADGNKGTFGKTLIVAGSYCMAGAAVMAASAAERMGCGMVKVYTRAENRVILQETLPACLLSAWRPEDPEAADRQLIADLGWADTVAVGPGLGKGDAEWSLVRSTLEHADQVDHIILDADAIRLIAQRDGYDLLTRAGAQTDVILTPHLAECAALLGTRVTTLSSNREAQLRTFAEAHHVTLLCKDARSMVVSPEDIDARTYLNTSGNDGLATAGSGDVLTGMLTACCAQGMSGLAAAAAASYLHGRLAEQAEEITDRRGLVAPDLYRQLNRANAQTLVWSESFVSED